MRSVTLPISAVLVVMLLGLVSPAATAKSVYKWTDDNGIIHYTAQPPRNRESEKVKTYGGGHSGPSPSSDKSASTPSADTSSSPAVAGEDKVEYEKDPKRCSIAKQNLATLQQNARVRIKDENGEYYFLTPEQHQQQMSEAEKAISESC